MMYNKKQPSMGLFFVYDFELVFSNMTMGVEKLRYISFVFLGRPV
jgi:hypothetical protein